MSKSATVILNPDYFSDFVSVSFNYSQGHRKMTANTSNSSLDYCNGLVGNYNDTYHHSVVKKLTDADYSSMLEKFEWDDKNPKFSVNRTSVKSNICFWFCVKC